MFNVDEQIARIETLFRQLTGRSPAIADPPLAPIPPDAQPEQHVERNLMRLKTALLAAGWFGEVPAVAPKVAVFDGADAWRCAIELPGVGRSDVTVQIHDGVLRVSAVRALAATPRYSEIVPCRYERALPLPPFARCESAEARLEDGVLSVRCAKDPAAQLRDVKIEVA